MLAILTYNIKYARQNFYNPSIVLVFSDAGAKTPKTIFFKIMELGIDIDVGSKFFSFFFVVI